MKKIIQASTLLLQKMISMAMASSSPASVFGGWPIHRINSGGHNGHMSSSTIQQYHQNRRPPSLVRRRGGQLRRPSSNKKNERIISVSEAIRRMEQEE